MTQTFKVTIHPEDGGFWAEVPTLPGCFTQAETLTELRKNLKEAIEGHLEVIREITGKSDATAIVEEITVGV